MFSIGNWKILGFLALILSGLGLSACNTMEGMGEDMGAAGNAIEEEAEQAQ